MKFFICGCNGMAGHLIAIYLHEQGHEVHGFARKKSPYIPNCIACNAGDTDLITKVIREGNFDCVINCIGILNQFAERNPADAVYVNSYFPHFLAKITADLDTQVIQMSTDCVFKGDRGGYIETDQPDGVTMYSRTKALGELIDDKNLTLRNSIVGPDININGIGLLNWFMKQTSCNGYTQTIWNGITTLELAKIMEVAAKEKIHGLYNMVPDDIKVRKYKLLELFNKYIRNNEVKITYVDGTVEDKSLIRTNRDFDYDIPWYDTMVSELAGWMKAHKQLYPHYNL